MAINDAWRWPLRSRTRLITLLLVVLVTALITKMITDNGNSSAAPPAASSTTAGTTRTSASSTTPTAVPTNPDQCVAQWAIGPDRDACLYRIYGYTPTSTASTTAPTPASPTSTAAPDVSTPTGIPSTGQYVPEADQAAALDVAARFVDAWYAGGSHQAWLGAVTQWADPTLATRLPTTDPGTVPGARRIGDPAMRGFQPGLAFAGVATDAGSLALTVIYTDAGWRVVQITPEPR